VRCLYNKRWDTAGSDGTTQPGLAHGNTEGKVDGHVGFLGAGVADEEVEAGPGDDAIHDPIARRRGLDDILEAVEDAILFGTVQSWILAGDVDLVDHGVGILLGGIHESTPAGVVIQVANAGDSLGGDRPRFGQPIRKRIRQVIEVDQVADDTSRTRISLVVDRVKTGEKGLIGHEIPPMKL
jgi:hypothetical protein